MQKLIIQGKKELKGKISIDSPKMQELRRFAYFYFIKTCIPWEISDKLYGGLFKGFNIDYIDDLMPGKNKILDHICKCIIDQKK